MKIGILWDLDGTLLNTLEDLTDSVNFALAQYGLPPRRVSEIRSFVGNGARRLIALAMPGKDTDPGVEAVLETYQSHYKTHAQIKTKPYPGIPEALQALGQRYPMAVVSNKPDAPTKLLCGQYFPGLHARGESADCPRKPAPDMLLKAMAELGAEGCVYVGDSEVDVITAGRAGVPCLSVTWGYRDREVLEESGSRYFCSDPSQLPDAIDAVVRDAYGQ